MDGNIGYESCRQAKKGDPGGNKRNFNVIVSNAQKRKEAAAEKGKYPVPGVPDGCKQKAEFFNTDRCGGSSCCIGCQHKPAKRGGKK